MGWPSRLLATILGKEELADFVAALPPHPDGLAEAPDGSQFQSPNRQALELELPYMPPGLWNLASTAAAIANHDNGNFIMSSLLCDAVLTDPDISGILSVRTRSLTGLPVSFLPPKTAKNTELAAYIADVLTREWRRMFETNEQEKFMRVFALMGISLGQNIWVKVSDDSLPGGTRLDPRVQTWSTRNLWWYWRANLDGPDRRNNGVYLLTTSNKVIEPIGGNGEWVFAQATRKAPWIEGKIRSVGYRFVARQQNFGNWNQWNARQALAVLKLITPMQENQQTETQINQQLRNPANPLVTLPQGADGNKYDLTWEYVKSSDGWKSIASLMEGATEEVCIDLLGQTLTTKPPKTGTGSYALGKVQESVSLKILESDVRAFVEASREQIIRPWVVMNWGDESLIPDMELQTEPDEDKLASSQAFSQIATAVATLAKAGVSIPGWEKLDLAQAMEDRGLPLMDEGDKPDPAAQTE